MNNHDCYTNFAAFTITMNTRTFDLVVVGSGGGPDETNLSAYLLKPANLCWEDGIIALEAGSGQGALRSLLQQNPNLFSQTSKECETELDQKKYTSGEIYSFIRSYLITHAHLDHINSLVISAGSVRGPRKLVYATNEILKDIETIFADRLWPNLGSWNETDGDHKFLYKNLEADGIYHTIQSNISVRNFLLSHGSYGEEGQPYHSSAFFIRHDPTSTEFLFFGDVEPDSLASTPLTINVWRAAAPKIPKALKTIFIECSWPIDRSDDLLFGHLTPNHLADELEALATEVVIWRENHAHKKPSSSSSSSSSSLNEPPPKRKKRNSIQPEELVGALEGLRVYIIHCKDEMTREEDTSPRRLITQQVRDLLNVRRLGVMIECAEPGMQISI